MYAVRIVTGDDDVAVRLNAEGGHGQAAVGTLAHIVVVRDVAGVHIGELQLDLDGGVLIVAHVGHGNGVTLGDVDGGTAQAVVVTAGVVVTDEEDDVEAVVAGGVQGIDDVGGSLGTAVLHGAVVVVQGQVAHHEDGLVAPAGGLLGGEVGSQVGSYLLATVAVGVVVVLVDDEDAVGAAHGIVGAVVVHTGDVGVVVVTLRVDVTEVGVLGHLRLQHVLALFAGFQHAAVLAGVVAHEQEAVKGVVAVVLQRAGQTLQGGDALGIGGGLEVGAGHQHDLVQIKDLVGLDGGAGSGTSHLVVVLVAVGGVPLHQIQALAGQGDEPGQRGHVVALVGQLVAVVQAVHIDGGQVLQSGAGADGFHILSGSQVGGVLLAVADVVQHLGVGRLVGVDPIQQLAVVDHDVLPALVGDDGIQVAVSDHPLAVVVVLGVHAVGDVAQDDLVVLGALEHVVQVAVDVLIVAADAQYPLGAAGGLHVGVVVADDVAVDGDGLAIQLVDVVGAGVDLGGHAGVGDVGDTHRKTGGVCLQIHQILGGDIDDLLAVDALQLESVGVGADSGVVGDHGTEILQVAVDLGVLVQLDGTAVLYVHVAVLHLYAVGQQVKLKGQGGVAVGGVADGGAAGGKGLQTIHLVAGQVDQADVVDEHFVGHAVVLAGAGEGDLDLGGVTRLESHLVIGPVGVLLGVQIQGVEGDALIGGAQLIVDAVGNRLVPERQGVGLAGLQGDLLGQQAAAPVAGALHGHGVDAVVGVVDDGGGAVGGLPLAQGAGLKVAVIDVAVEGRILVGHDADVVDDRHTIARLLAHEAQIQAFVVAGVEIVGELGPLRTGADTELLVVLIGGAGLQQQGHIGGVLGPQGDGVVGVGLHHELLTHLTPLGSHDAQRLGAVVTLYQFHGAGAVDVGPMGGPIGVLKVAVDDVAVVGGGLHLGEDDGVDVGVLRQIGVGLGAADAAEVQFDGAVAHRGDGGGQLGPLAHGGLVGLVHIHGAGLDALQLQGEAIGIDLVPEGQLVGLAVLHGQVLVEHTAPGAVTL